MEFYYVARSPYCRAVIVVADLLGIELNKINLDPALQEHLTPEFIKLNPQHTIPTLVDDGFSVWESRAILQYLVEKYGKEDDPLYPKCVKKRAVINQRLYFDMGTLYSALTAYYIPINLFKKEPDAEKYKKLEEAVGFTNTFLEGQTYFAGDALTIADISLLGAVSCLDVFGFDLAGYLNVHNWYEHIKKVMPGWEAFWEGSVEMIEFLKEYSTKMTEK